jgi:pyrroline-5-carboxylate reductase
MGLERALEFLEGTPLGLFGAGHLGRAIASSLLQTGWPRQQLLLCHSGSPRTEAMLAAADLLDRAVAPQRLLDAAKMVFYLVRPQAADAVGGFAMRPDALLVSFLAGTKLERISAPNRLRAMISDPETLVRKNGIAALYPQHAAVESMFAALGLRVLRLSSEESFAAFTALGPCLPIAAAWCLATGTPIDRASLFALGRRYDLAAYPDIVEWALDVCPKNLRRSELETYVAHAATPGGVTDAVLRALQDGKPLAAALERGVQRCEELAQV